MRFIRAPSMKIKNQTRFTQKLMCAVESCCRNLIQSDVRFGSKADIEARLPDVRFTPESGHRSVRVACPLNAKSGHSAPGQTTPLFDHLVGGNEQVGRYIKAECLGGLE